MEAPAVTAPPVAAATPATAAAARTGWRSRRFTVPGQLVLVALAGWLLVAPQVRRSSTSLGLLFDIDNGWIPVAIVAELLSLIAYALTTRSMLPRASRPSLSRILRIDLSSIALGHCLPDGGAAGTALCWRLLVAAGVPSAEAAFAKLAQGAVAAVVLQALLVGAFALGLTTSDLGRWNAVPAAMSVTVLITATLLVVLLRRAAVRRALHAGLSRVPRYGARVAAWVAGLYRRHAVDQLRSTFPTSRHALLTAGYAAANWLFDALALWASVSAYGSGITLEGLAAAFAIQTFAAWLPLTPSGLGISEGLMIPALVASGASASSAVLGVLTWRVLAYWLPMPMGALAYSSLRLRDRRQARR